MGASVGVSVGFTPFVPTPLHYEGVVKETRGFIGARDLLSEGTESEIDFGFEILVVGALGRMRRWNKWRFLIIINQTVHEESSQEMKFGTLEHFGKYVCPHEIHWAVLKIELL